jgi:hypothetical protein
MSSLILGNKKTDIQTRPRPSIDKKQLWIGLAPFIKKRFDTGDKTLKEIAADLALADYYEQKRKDEEWRRFSEEIG